MRYFIREKKSFFLITSLMSCSVAMGATQSEPQSTSYSQMENRSDFCDKTTVQCPPTVCAYNAPLLLNPCSYLNLYITGSFLYWKASSDYLAYAFLDNSVALMPPAPSDLLFNGKTLEPNFKYKPGFQLGLGYKFHRDQWDLYAKYTYFHQTTHTFKSVTPGGQHMHPIWLVFIAPVFIVHDNFKSCSSAWNTNFDILDAEIGRSFFCGRHLTFRPSLGLRTLWLNQSYNLIYTSLLDAIPVYSFNKSHSWGVGPRLALNNRWNLSGGFGVVGDLGISLLHVEDQVTIKHSTPALHSLGISPDITYANNESISLIKPVLDLSLGLGWGRPFFCDKYAFNLDVTYDYSLYYDQASIQLGHAPIVYPGTTPQVIVGNTALSTGNISIQGLKITARLDF